ncbi:diphthine--ammonia ligase [Candidatus Woesearchaeota archaeon]|nr:diphthine--ammonia ligase [Candidatus Woesearchaeota archaeon]MCF7901647.1 diphthine--ammonia ligase [Candidatus Woesearchaeota archaeon]MCF8014046.1 diphthine--ammonia ligase [Candidatus Woesearchaeota archaeon]
MCGIIGFFNFEGKENEEKAKNGLSLIDYRGKDGTNFDNGMRGCIGHCLHAIIDKIPQPLTDEKFIFSTNCEIYNWKELKEKHKLDGKNDAEVLFNFLKNSHDLHASLEELDGVSAFALWNKEIQHVFLARDIIGVKPLWYYHDPQGKFAFASERKALISQDLDRAYIKELNPRKIIMYDIQNKELKEYEREFFKVQSNTNTEEQIMQTTEELIEKAIQKRIIKDKKIGILFSGGIDSTYIAYKLKKLGIPFVCYTAALKEPGLKDAEDTLWAKNAAKELGFDLKIKEVPLDEVPEYLKKILPLIEDNNVVKAGVALPFYLCSEMAKEDGVKILFSGLGSEEIFAGYQRHENSQNINEECLAGLRKIYERDLYRDDCITMSQTIELRLPFLDKELVKYALTIPEKLKLNKDQKKIILREIAKKQGLPELFAERKKKAAQYGSNFDKAIQKLANQEKKTKAQYLKQFYDEGNVKLGALLSTGKDSVLATQIMMEQNYEIACFITIQSHNKDSYMYHGPNTHLATVQAEAAQIPIILKDTKGEKEKELQDLKEAIKEAITKHKIEGIITGALFSNYQRERIEKICEDLGIKCFSPLWHMNQEKEVQLLIDKGFKFTIIKIAAEGMHVGWLGETITQKHLERLKILNQKIGFNIAGEGGEYESLVLDAPFFKKQIIIKKSQIITESEIEATMIIQEVQLKEKN